MWVLVWVGGVGWQCLYPAGSAKYTTPVVQMHVHRPFYVCICIWCGWVGLGVNACIQLAALSRQPPLYKCISRIGQNRIYSPYMTVYFVISLPKSSYIHRIYRVLANPMHKSATLSTFVYAFLTPSDIYQASIQHPLMSMYLDT